MQYYKKEEFNKSKFLTANMAREITNEAIIKKIQERLLLKKAIQTLIATYQILIIKLQLII